MSISKLWAIIAGIESVKWKHAHPGEAVPEELTPRSVAAAAKKLDKALGYTAGGGRGEKPKPGDGSEERLKDYLSIGEKRKHPVLPENAGSVTITVCDAGGMPLAAELKLFPMGETGTEQEFSFTEGETTDFYRRYTDWSGSFTMRIPAGRYLVTAGRGAEYAPEQTVLTVGENGTAVWNVVLSRFIDLGKQGWYAGDLHHHSVYSSPLYPPQGTDYVYDTAAEVAMSMQAAGLSFGALSDHHNVLNHREWEALGNEKFLPILSKEISTTNGHVLSLNVDSDVIYHIPEEKDRTPELMRGEFVRVCKEIRELGGFPQLNHPRENSKSIAFPAEFTDMIEVFDTLEIWNGSDPMEDGTKNGRALELWLSLLEEGRFLAATTGSDTHEVSLEFWQDSFAYLTGLYHMVETHFAELDGEVREKAEYFLRIVSPNLPLLCKWGRLNLSSGCVRTYVHIPRESGECKSEDASALPAAMDETAANETVTDGNGAAEVDTAVTDRNIAAVDSMELVVNAAVSDGNRAAVVNAAVADGNRAAVVDAAMADGNGAAVDSRELAADTRLPASLTPHNVLTHLKAGHSFLTNGPVLIAEIDGKSMGETVCLPANTGEVTAKLTILANRPLTKLFLWQNGGRCEELPLPDTEKENGHFDYSGEVKISAKNAKWIFFQVKDDYTNQAMTNPIFFQTEGE